MQHDAALITHNETVTVRYSNCMFEMFCHSETSGHKKGCHQIVAALQGVCVKMKSINGEG